MRTRQAGLLAMALTLTGACGGSSPMSATAVPQPVVAPTPQPPLRSFPPPTGPSRTFAFDRELSYPVRDYTKRSRLILYDNGAFVLRYEGIGDYRGGYKDENGALVFEWEGWSVAGGWSALGRIERQSLTIEYNFIMQMSDFENAVYVFTP